MVVEMSDRLIDPTRQGIGDPAPDLTGQAPPISLEEAISIVDGWSEWFGPWPLHQVARALRRGLSDRDEMIEDGGCYAEHMAVVSLAAQEEVERLRAQAEEDAARLGTLRRENEALQRENQALRREAAISDAAFEQVEIDAGIDAARIQGLRQLRRENDELRQELEERREMAIELQLDADAQRALYRREEARADKLQSDHDKLSYQSRMMELALVDAPDDHKALIEHYTLRRTIDLMEVWRPEVERWGLHQMCRVLRQRLDVIPEAREAIHSLQAICERALAAIPCARAKDDCTCPDYRWAPCCNLRVAMWAGEPFDVDPLDDDMLHLFAPTVGQEPRKSTGCVKLVEPTIYERNETLDWNFKQ